MDLEKVKLALEANGITVFIVDNGAQAKQKVLELIPHGSEVMGMSSITLQQIGLTDIDTVKKKLATMNRQTQNLEMQKMGTAPEYTVGSVHAVTVDGKILIASNTGSQLPAYVYGSPHVIWVVGQQKIVPTVDDGIKRIYDYILPLESARLSKAYGKDIKSFVSKLLIINREINPTRLTMILVKENLGF